MMVNVFPRPKKAAFLAALAACGNITEAAKMAGCDRSAHYAWMKDDAAYPAMFAFAMDESIELLEKEARRRAVEGVEEPVYQGKELVGSIQKYSDTLLIFLLKGARPDKYRDNVNISYDLSQLTDQELEQFDNLSAKVIPISSARRSR